MMRGYALMIDLSLAVTLALSCSSPGGRRWRRRCGNCNWTGIRRRSASYVVAVKCIFIGKVHVVTTWKVLGRLVYLGRRSGRSSSSCRCNFGLSS